MNPKSAWLTSAIHDRIEEMTKTVEEMYLSGYTKDEIEERIFEEYSPSREELIELDVGETIENIKLDHADELPLWREPEKIPEPHD